ncbi:MAG: glucose-1-phosphate adenylyltransferase [Anaerolineae bacterium]|nr:glucose-1-phosphate adenylyltransferase [Anaerolineae bacterium]
MPTTNDIVGVILGGGIGTRLYPLTKLRAKPAVPIAGKYRLIDVPMSNCINAGIHKIAVLTQFNSVSLHRHISQTYVFDAFSRGWVQILAAEQTPHSQDWYQGTADAVRKQLLEIKAADTDYTLILAGDHLYRMNYDDLAQFHWDNNADITIAVQPVLREDASRYGLLKMGPGNIISDFAEKPKDGALLKEFISRENPEKPYLGSMGIYMFKTEVLVEILSNSTDTDFGKEVIPRSIGSHQVYGFEFEGYWQDIGTIRSFYETNLSLTRPNPPFNFHDPEDTIYTRPRFLPGALVMGGDLENVLLADGSRIGRAKVSNSIAGLRSQISDGAVVDRTIIMGADYYDNELTIEQNGGIPIGVGNNARISGAIIDKNVRIGEDVVIHQFPPGTEMDLDQWSVRDGIVVVPKDVILKPGTYIGPEK